MSKEWILDAYNDIIAANRIKVPHEIQINVDSYKGVTIDGQNEQELLAAFSQLVDREKKVALDALVFTDFARYCFPGGLGIAGIGLVLAFTGSPWLGAVIVIVGILAALYSKGQEEEINTKRQAAEVQFNKKKVEGAKVIRAMIAEIVDYRAEFVKKDKESENVIDFLNQIKPDQYVQNQDYESRLIKGLC